MGPSESSGFSRENTITFVQMIEYFFLQSVTFDFEDMQFLKLFVYIIRLFIETVLVLPCF